MKDIVIIANFCRDFSETDNGRFMYLCKELSKDNKVEIITSDFLHGAGKHKEPLIHNWAFKIKFLHEIGYPKNICIKRFISHYSWGREVVKYLRTRKKPDVVYCAVPSLTAPLKVAKYCESNGVRFIIDIQDLWPEAFKMAFDIPLLSDLIFAPLHMYANGIYRRADDVCAVSKTYAQRAMRVNRKCNRMKVAFLGTKLDVFDEYSKKNRWSRDDDELWLAYCGSLSESYDITFVIDALALLQSKGTVPPKFIIMGDGHKRAEFESYAAKKSINVLFTGMLPYDQMCGLLCSCDITINPIAAGSAGSIINKHGDYAAAGLPVLNTQDSKEYQKLVKEYKMGFNCKNGDVEGLADKLQRLVKDEDLRLHMGINARRCAEEKFDRCNSYQELLECILR